MVVLLVTIDADELIVSGWPAVAWSRLACIQTVPEKPAPPIVTPGPTTKLSSAARKMFPLAADTFPEMNMLWPDALAVTNRIAPGPVTLAPARVPSTVPQWVRNAPPSPALSVKLLPPLTPSDPKFVV